jgi:hypothetical protein
MPGPLRGQAKHKYIFAVTFIVACAVVLLFHRFSSASNGRGLYLINALTLRRLK